MSDRPETPLEQRTLELWTSCSWRRFHFREGGAACEPITQASDGHPDLYFPGGFEGPVARRFLATWNAVRGISTAHLDAIQKAPRTLAMIFHDYIQGADERGQLVAALRICQMAIDQGMSLDGRVAANGPTLREVIDRALKHGNVTP